jgi:putative ABC transport system permease protein
MLGPIGAVLRDLDAGAPVFDLETMDARIADRLAAQRSAGFLLGLLSILGLVLSAVGTYGLAAYWAGQRLREFGIRVALGATPREIVRLVLRHGSIAAGIGLVVGLTLAALGSRALSGRLFGVGSLDPIAFSGAAAVLALVALLATYMPASRASRVDPVAVLRIE